MRNKAFLTSPAVPSDASSYPYITIRVVCSKGTYIRALARDIGQALHSGANLTALRRTRVGDVRAEDCLSMETFPTWLEQQDIEIPAPALEASSVASSRVREGRKATFASQGDGGGDL